MMRKFLLAMSSPILSILPRFMDNVKRKVENLEFFWENFLFWRGFEAGELDLKIENWRWDVNI